MTDNPADFDDIISKTSRYSADKHNWLEFAPDGSFEHDTIADQIDELYTAMRESSPTAEEAVSAFIEIFASDFETPPKAKS